MGRSFKMKYNNSSFPFKSGEIKTVVDKERVGPVENVDLDREIEEHNKWHEEDEKSKTGDSRAPGFASLGASEYIRGKQLRKKKLNIKKRCSDPV